LRFNRSRRLDARRPVRPGLEALEERALPSVVGYVNDWNNGNNEARVIQATGNTAVALTDADLATYNLASLDALIIEMAPPPTGRSATLLANWGNVLNYVNRGGRLILHDADPGANATQPIIPGLEASTFVQVGSQFLSVSDSTSPIINGPFGTLDDHSFDWGSFSSHGYVDAATLPSYVHVLMVNRSSQFGPAQTNQAAVLSYNYGSGYVVYDTVPAAYYLQFYDDLGWPIGVNVNRKFLPNEINAALTANRAPTADTGGPYVITEGNGLTLNAGASFDPDQDPLTYTWDVNGDGVFGDAVGVSPTLTWAQLQALGIADDGSFAVSVRVDDGRGLSATASTTLTVKNAPPIVTAGPNVIISEGSTFNGLGSFADPGADVWTATVDFGDGTGAQPLSLNADQTFSLNHVYAHNGTFTVTVTVADDDGGVGSDTLQVKVDNVPPTVNPGPNATINEGGLFTEIGLFADPGMDTWTATVDYGDGSGVQALALNADKTFGLSHVYADNGSFTVTVAVTDGSGATGIGTLIVTVNNVAPTVVLGPTASVNEGSAFVAGGAFTDPGADVWSATVDYGDGSGPQALVLNADKTFALDHVYADNGVYVVTIQVTDDDGGVGTATQTVNVSNVAPTVNLAPTAILNEGSTFTGTGSFTDPGADTWTATVDYGDGSGLQTLALNPDKTFTLSHLYAVSGSFTVTVSVQDDDGGVGTGSVRVGVNPVNPVIVFGPVLPVTEGSPFVDTGSFNHPGSETWTATVDYGDGSGVQALTLNPDNTFALNHLYAVNGSFIVTVTLSDGAGAGSTGTLSVTVTNVAPEVTLISNLITLNQGQTFTATGSFTDPGIETWTATVDYGDGSGVQTLSLNADKTFALNHVYAAAGQFTATVTIQDQDGATGSASLQVTVLASDVAPLVGVIGPTRGVRGQPLTYSFTASALGSTTGSYVYVVQWGDGSPVQTITATPGNGAGVAVSHVFTHVGTYAIHVTATDAIGNQGSANYQVTIRPVLLENDPKDPNLSELVVGGTVGNDVILLRPGRGSGEVRVFVNTNDLGTFLPTGRVVVYGQAGNDVIWVNGPVKQSTWLFGGTGNDVLVSGEGDNVLVGDDGDDVLVGRGRRDLLIGGRGRDVLLGLGGQALLIGDATAFDHDEIALGSIMAEWSSNRSRAERIANLKGKGQGPRLNGDNFLTWRGPSATVHRDHHHDGVFGRPGKDWVVPSLDG
jgi:hypothetical protein